jgi:hypothetical protein
MGVVLSSYAVISTLNPAHHDQLPVDIRFAIDTFS